MGTPLQDRGLMLAQLYENYLKSEVDKAISPTDTMMNQWYFPVGLSAAQVVYAACLCSWVGEVKTILDLPCGHGRVLRHLVKLFPSATVDGCDLDREGVEFCERQFNARGIVSNEDLLQVDFARQYDLIWVGSLFTHTNRARTKSWLQHLTNFLSPNGIIVATFHGRYSLHKGLEFGYIEKSRWSVIVDQYIETGYGYADYPREANHNFIEGAYGVSVSNPAVIIADAMQIPDVRIFSYTERGWAGHQDVLVIGRPQVMS